MSRIGRTGELCESKLIEWNIADFYSLSETKGSCYESPSFTFYNDTWHLRIYPGGARNAERGFLSLYLEKETRWPSPCSLSVTLCIRKTDGTVIKPIHGDLSMATRSLGLACNNFFDRSVLKQSESELLPLGVLTICCTLNHDGRQDIIKTDTLNEKREIVDYGHLTDLDVLSENLRGLFTNQDSCDIVLEVKEKEFKAHKAILIGRSPVFAAMLQPHTLESQTGVIKILDCDPESFQQFLEYLFCGKLEDNSFYSAFHLYSTSNKYDVQNLKEQCVENLIKNLAVDNVCEIVILADKHDDKKLASATQDFFTENYSAVFLTTDWDNLMRNDYRLAKKLLIEMSKVKGS